MRLQRFLAECGVASRRHAETLITAGRVTVNGNVATLGQSVDVEQDVVAVDGKTVERHEEKVYILLNKAAGIVTSAIDPFGRKTVLDCIQGVQARVYPVGRLDRDVEGALLLTNDGEMALRLTHPRYQIDKVYLAKVRGLMSKQTAALLRAGVKLEDGVAKAAVVDILKHAERSTNIRLVMREGRKHEVKRLLEEAGHPVRELRRLSMAGITTDGLKPGEWRRLNKDEVKRLQKLTGLA
ncbi:MAG TPA: pseudouridine synthase [Candidatus Hydrogenedentes bacterium]|nr:pseudouridine synthase [Candidatus Hydrogenedentota bacterium]HOS04164.1 pseudouridine synthase [Candidatus Hydrogenedentota bacterium]